MPGPSSGTTTSSQHACNCGKAATRSKGGSLHHGHSHHHHQPHSTISSNIRKELASFENPYQSHASAQGKKPTKRNASTESLDLFEKYHQEEDECTCGLYSPRSFATERAKNCQKCTVGGKARTGMMGGGQAGHKKHNSSKFKDASTSPKSSSPLKTVKLDCRSPKTVDEKESKFDFSSSPKTTNHYRRLSSLTINGANKQNAATSPMKHASALSTNEKVTSSTPSPRMSPQKLGPGQNGGEQQRTLEKSNSLGDNKPPRLLRTTRSLSPRPPVRHQHSIMVSDENDIISVKLSPNQDFLEDGSITRGQAKEQLMESCSNISVEVGSIANSEGVGELKLDDCLKSASNNRSTSCLVYVPSDPWTKMSTNNVPSPPPSVRQQKSKTLDNNCKAYGKPSLDYMKNCDPWVWRSNVQLTDGSGASGGGGKASKKRQHGLPHQTKSLTAGTAVAMSHDDCDIAGDGKQRSAKLYQQQSLGRLEKTLNIPGVAEIGSSGSFDARKKITRPKLQRSKSPSFYEDFFQNPSQTGYDKNKSPQASGSHSLAKNKSVSSLKMEKNASNSNLNGHGHNSHGANSNHHSSNSGSSSTVSNNGSSYGNYNGNGSPTTKKQPSPKFSILSSSSSSSKHQSPPRKLPTLCQPEPAMKTSQNLLNPNLLQPRHSFSTPSQKDDELQLNIRRLSEQMNNKYNHHSAAPAFLNDTIVQQQQQQQQSKKAGVGSGSSLSASIGGGSTGGINDPPAGIQRKAASHSKINEPILETRC